MRVFLLACLLQGWGEHAEGSKERADKQQQQERIRMKLGQFICRTWNNAHANTEYELRTFDILIYVKAQPKPNCPLGVAQDTNVIREDRVWEHRCFD